MMDVRRETEVEELEARKVEYNTKPNFISHLIAGLVDLLTVVLLAFGLYSVEMNTPMSTYPNELKDEMNLITRDYMLSETYGAVGEKVYDVTESIRITQPIFKEEDGTEYYVKLKETATQTQINDAYNALQADQKYQAYKFNHKFATYGLMILAASVSEFVLIFIIPILSKRRATLGRLLGGTVLINKKREVKAKIPNVLARFFFALIIDTALPLLFLSEILAALIIPVLRLLTRVIDKKNNRCVADFISFTMVVDKNTYKPITEQ